MRFLPAVSVAAAEDVAAAAADVVVAAMDVIQGEKVGVDDEGLLQPFVGPFRNLLGHDSRFR